MLEMGSEDSSVTDLLGCPVCTAIMHPPIHQCFNAHTICFTCKAKVNNICPICRQELGNIRYLPLEKLAEKTQRIYLPCEYRSFGCPDISSYNNAIMHERICTFRPYFNCPYHNSTCLVTGDIKTLIAHLKKDHTVKYVDVADGSTFNNIYKMNDDDKAKWRSSLCNCFGHHFYLHFEAFTLANPPVLMAFLRFMGNENEANKFRYCLEVGGSVRKMMWQGVPRSIKVDDKTVRDSYDGLIIQKHIALFFSGLERKLNVTARIWRV